MSHDDHSFHAKKSRSFESFLIYTHGFIQHHMIGVAVHQHGFAIFIVYIRKSLYENCLCASNITYATHTALHSTIQFHASFEHS